MSASNLHPLFASIVSTFAPPPVEAPVIHDTRVERCEGEDAYGYEARCSCGWQVWRRYSDVALDAGRDHESGHEVV